MSSKAARGVKRTCQKCGKRFYDLGREPIICPYCEEEFKLAKPDEEALAREKLEAEKLAAEKKKAAEAANLKDAASEVDPELTEVDDDELADIEDIEEVEADGDDDAADTFLPDDDDDDDDVSDILGEVAPKTDDDL
jgi:uncharacterized protein (TIGR02300 family)